jgi:CheY-like chemotaxis protein
MAKVKILVVEDEAITAENLQDMLTDLGYDAPAIASSGEGAIKMAEEIKPDLILMDIVLKGYIDGIEAAEQIHDRFDVPVVYLTAYIDEERREKTKVTEPFGYIIKPFEDAELRPAIEIALQRHKREKALRESEEKFRTFLDSASDLMNSVDIDGNITYVNESMAKTLGYSKLKAVAVYDSDGKYAGSRAVFRDPTEWKQAGDTIKKKNEELELFNKLAVGRERMMIELKKEINALLEDLGKEPRYKIAGEEVKKNYELRITNYELRMIDQDS